jgi:hypothetical protein
VRDKKEDPNFGHVDAWQVCEIGITGGWARTWPGVGAGDIKTNSSGDIYLAGCNENEGGDLDPGPNVILAPTGGILTRFAKSGTYMSTVSFGYVCYSICIDKYDFVYATGMFFDGDDLDPGPGSYTPPTHGQHDAFLLKMDPECNMVWLKTWGSDYRTTGEKVSVDGAGNLYVSGFFNGLCDFDPGSGIVSLNDEGMSDIYLSKFDSSGNFQWARKYGDFYKDRISSISADSQGNVFMTGIFNWPPDNCQNVLLTQTDFVQKIGPSGDLIFENLWPNDEGYLLFHDSDIDPGNNLITGGAVIGPMDFDPGQGEAIHTSVDYDSFLCKFSPSGQLVWSKYWDTDDDGMSEVFCIDIDPVGMIYVTGRFWNIVDFDPGPGVYELHSSYFGNWGTFFADGYLARYDSTGKFYYARSWTGDPNSEYQMTENPSGYVYITGGLFGLVTDFDPGDGYSVTDFMDGGTFLYKLRTNGTW